MKILFLAFEVPYPLDRGGRIKTYFYLKALAKSNQVTLVALARTPECSEKLEYLGSELSICSFHSIYIGLSSLRKARIAVQSLFQEEPFVMSLYGSSKGKRLVDHLIRMNSFDLIYADHLHMAQYVPKTTKAMTLLDQHNVETIVLQRFLDTRSELPLRLFAQLELSKMSRYEPQECRRFDAIWVTTEVDRRIIAPWIRPDQFIQVLPIGVDTGFFRPEKSDRDPATILSVGTLNWPANSDGVMWFCTEILPLLKEHNPEVKYVIVGANPPTAISRLADDPAVEITGWVEDIRPYLAKSTVLAVPLRGGSGMRVKILDALAAGIPIVSTSVGCEGIEVTPGVNILLADDVSEFAQKLATLLQSPQLQSQLSQNGIRLARDKYDWEIICDQIGASVTELKEHIATVRKES